MRKLLPVIILILISKVSFSQKDYTVVYTHAVGVDSPNQVLQPQLSGFLYVKSDTLAIYRLSREKKASDKNFDLSKMEAHHSIVKPLKAGFYYHVVHYPLGVDGLIKTPDNTKPWQISADTTIIAGILCIAAKRDELTAWYAPSLPVRFGPMAWSGLPGLILKGYDSNLKILIEAQKIIDKVPEIVTSKQVPVITWDDYEKMKKEKVKQ